MMYDMFSVMFVVPSTAVSRHDRTGVILSRLHRTIYAHSMAAALLNISIANDVMKTSLSPSLYVDGLTLLHSVI